MTPQRETLTFEEAMSRLEEIVRILEAGERPLEETVRLYEEGQRLRQVCEQYLVDAEQRITTISRTTERLVALFEEDVSDLQTPTGTDWEALSEGDDIGPFSP